MKRLDRQPPYSAEAEQGFLGCLLLEPRSVLSECEGMIGLDSFYDLRHRTIYDAILALFHKGVMVNIVTLTIHLSTANRLEECGGSAYISSLPEATPSSANASYYAEILEEKSVLRKLIQVCTATVQSVYEDAGNVEAILSAAEQAVMGIRRNKIGQAAVMQQIVLQAMDDIERLHQSQGQISGLSTGFTDLDRVSDGLHPGEMIVLAAYPSVGKSSLLMNIVEHIVLDLNMAAAVFSLEMKSKRLVMRVLASRARVNMRDIRTGAMNEKDFKKLTVVSAKLANAPLSICDATGISISQIRSKARAMAGEKKIAFIGIDYLQLVKGIGGSKESNREQEVASISRGVKELAGELDIPVMALSQLNDEGKLRESRAIGQDADSFWRLVPVDANDTRDCTAVNLEMKKQRDGPAPYTVPLTFFKSFTRFESAAKISEPPLPYKD